MRRGTFPGIVFVATLLAAAVVLLATRHIEAAPLILAPPAGGSTLYPHPVVQDRPAPELVAGLEVRALMGPDAAYSSIGTRTGYAAQLGVAVGPRSRGVIRAAFFPSGSRRDETPACDATPYSGDGSPTADMVASAVSCISSRDAYTVGVGVEKRIALGRRLWVSPAIYLDGAFLPDVVVPYGSESGGGLGTADMLAVGPVVRSRFAFALVKRLIRLELGLEVSGGLLASDVEEAVQLAVPLSATASAGIAF